MNAGQKRLMRIASALFKLPQGGASAAELREQLGLDESPATVWRDLQTLHEMGWAQRTADLERWKLGAELERLARGYAAGLLINGAAQ